MINQKVGVIKGTGESKSLKKGRSTAIQEYNAFVTIQQGKGNLTDRKRINQEFTIDDLKEIANDQTFQEYSFYLVETAQKNLLKEITGGTIFEIEIDENFNFENSSPCNFFQ